MQTSAVLRHGVKLIVAHVLYYTGILHVLQRIVLRKRAVVLMYHRVLSEEERALTSSHPGIVVSTASFEAHMAVVKRRFVALSAADFSDRLTRKVPFPSSSCLITFDDGWYDNWANALPVLERHNLPALIFLPVNYIGRQRQFWQERVTRLIARGLAAATTDVAMRNRLAAILEPIGLGSAFSLPADRRREAIAEAVGFLKAAPQSARDSLIAELIDLGLASDDANDPDRFLSWDQVRVMGGRGVTFGGHGAEHRLLTQVRADAAEQEVLESRTVLAEHVGDVAAFSYPNGSWNAEIAAIVREHGYQMAFTTEPGSVSSSDDRYALKRINIHEHAASTTPLFLARVVGLF
jgi:peptidoglycan/xylan/chitin deacetylase (PgdA/CDA1 family)